MPPQEAIKWLKSIENKYIHGGDEAFDKSRKIAISKAISALENQIPQKPLEKELGYDGEYGRCPCCNSAVADYDDVIVCGQCGQVLDWSDT